MALGVIEDLDDAFDLDADIALDDFPNRLHPSNLLVSGRREASVRAKIP